MTSQSKLAIAERLPTEAASGDDWVLSLSREEPGCVRWAERGPLRGFFRGLLFDREALAGSADRGQPDRSDADLVLRSYERGGEAALSRLRGSFVVAVIDRARDIAIVARDPLGLHPLFYVETSSGVLFAAAPQPLLDQPGISRALNRAALADHLCSRWPDRHETFFAAVRRVPPGWRAVISRGCLRLERYWDPTPKERPTQWLTAEEASRFDEVFDRAVDRCVRHGPTGVFLSGGLDSISVAAVATDRARQFGQDPPLALSLAFPDPECDERLLQAAVARDLGIRQHLVGFHEALGSRPLFEMGLELHQQLSAPLLNPWAPAYLALARRASLQGVCTILTGHGGDEWLTATPYLSADLIRRGAVRELVEFWGALRRSYPVTVAQACRQFCRYGLRPLAGLALHRLMPEIHEASRVKRLLAADPVWMTPDRELRAQQRCRAGGVLPAADPPEGFYMREGPGGIDSALASWDLEERYQLGQRIGVRFLHPLSDPDLVDMLHRMPLHVLNEGGRTKGLIRQTLARRFPGLGLERQRKVVSSTFFQSVVLREVPALLNVAGDFPALSALGIVDGRVMRTAAVEGLRHATAAKALTQRGRQISKIWQAINLEMWIRSYGRQQAGYVQGGHHAEGGIHRSIKGGHHEYVQ